MLGFIKRWNDRRKWEGSVLGQALAQHTQTFFYGGTMLTSLPQEQKERLIGRFSELVASIGQSPTGFLDLRKSLAEWVAQYARFQVLALTESEKASSFYAANPFVSGALHHHIRKAAEKNDDLARAIWGNANTTDHDLISQANTECAVALYYANGLNMVRLESGDRTERDWFKPFVEALLIYEEDNVRADIQLPRLLPDDKDGVIYSGFFNQVAVGEPDPFFSWSRACPNYYLSSGAVATSSPAS
ncbi:hypothetical protein E0H39_29750 [Rhizobium leguminosarum bv. viciae]|uniref:hypothetical protein n=1 Tax=Rhizobium leguminosarum TaxID=384 RepID=UPI00103FBF29|nr:hypothetical protein [Rhizobium leguminosarum]TBY57692.1 hypothetical protein E0H39_29750 [Rhizobium leguminosarum bv. viciae]